MEMGWFLLWKQMFGCYSLSLCNISIMFVTNPGYYGSSQRKPFVSVRNIYEEKNKTTTSLPVN